MLFLLRIFFALSLIFAWCESVEAGNSLSRLHLGTYNIRNFGAGELKSVEQTTNQFLLKQIINEANSDIMTVQEIVDETAFAQFLGKSFPQYKFILSKCGGTGNQKLGILYNSNYFKLNWSVEDQRIADGDSCHGGLRPALIAELESIRGRAKIHVVAVHLKAGGRPNNIETRFRQLEIIGQIVEELRQKNRNHIVVMGDFNTTEYIQGGEYAERFKSKIREFNLIDFAEEIDCSSYWKGAIPEENLRFASLLDHIIVSKELHTEFKRDTSQSLAHCKKKSCRQETAEGLGLTYNEVSDHCPVVAKLF